MWEGMLVGVCWFSGVTGGGGKGQGAECPPSTSDREISADLLGKNKEKSENWEEKKENWKREGRKLKMEGEKITNEEGIFLGGSTEI